MRKNAMNDKNSHMFLWIILILAVTILYSAYGIFAEEKETRQLKVSVIIDNSSSSRWNAFHLGLEEAAKDLVVDLDISSTGRWDEENDQLSFIHSKEDWADGMILAPFERKQEEDVKFDLPIALVESDSGFFSERGKTILVVPDYQKIAEELMKTINDDFARELQGKNVKLLTSRPEQESMKEVMEELLIMLEKSQCNIMQPEIVKLESGEKYLENNIIDIVIALDDDALEMVTREMDSNKNRSNVAIYGIGSGNSNVYYLSQGLIQGMILTNDYKMGYESLTALSESIRSRKTTTKRIEVDFRMIRPSQVHNPEIEKILYPNIQ